MSLGSSNSKDVFQKKINTYKVTTNIDNYLFGTIMNFDEEDNGLDLLYKEIIKEGEEYKKSEQDEYNKFHGTRFIINSIGVTKTPINNDGGKFIRENEDYSFIYSYPLGALNLKLIKRILKDLNLESVCILENGNSVLFYVKGDFPIYIREFNDKTDNILNIEDK